MKVGMGTELTVLPLTERCPALVKGSLRLLEIQLFNWESLEWLQKTWAGSVYAF